MVKNSKRTTKKRVLGDRVVAPAGMTIPKDKGIEPVFTGDVINELGMRVHGDKDVRKLTAKVFAHQCMAIGFDDAEVNLILRDKFDLQPDQAAGVITSVKQSWKETFSISQDERHERLKALGYELLYLGVKRNDLRFVSKMFKTLTEMEGLGTGKYSNPALNGSTPVIDLNALVSPEVLDTQLEKLPKKY